MTKLKKIGVLSAAKIFCLIYFFVGLILALIFAVIGSIIGSIFGSENGELMVMFGSLIFAIVAIPIIYGILGFIVGAIGAALYNLIAKWIGGVEIELENK